MMRTSWLLTLTLLSGCGWGGPPQPLFTVSGRVLDGNDVPVPGAVVTDGNGSVLTEENGRYSLAVFSTHLTVTKPGLSTVRFEVEKGDSPTSHLAARPGAPKVGLDTRWGAADLKGLRTALGAALKSYPATPLAELDALVMVTPGYLDPAEQAALDRWIRAGGRLVLAGEWGGYPSQSLDTLNTLAQPAGITFTGATVKIAIGPDDTEGWDSSAAIAPASLATLAGGTDPVYMFTSTSLALGSPARAILQSDKRAYSVLATSSRLSSQVLAAVGATGSGKVFALGDSSLWLDEASDGGGTPNVARGANARLASALVAW
ncbi:MAG: hypothetical protein JWM80_1135 [Cyanobacteria bacterium RYN_339]|nr:hypothetical protein [Cyanobacteria bacterium RYN_339]